MKLSARYRHWVGRPSRRLGSLRLKRPSLRCAYCFAAIDKGEDGVRVGRLYVNHSGCGP